MTLGRPLEGWLPAVRFIPPKEDLATLYRAPWNNELDLRSIKSTMQMEVLRCKTPELVQKEIWMHILAYNLIRTIMAQAASVHDIEPRSISFKGALQTLEAFQPLIDFQGIVVLAFAGNSISSCWTPSPVTKWPIAATALNLVRENADPSSSSG